MRLGALSGSSDWIESIFQLNLFNSGYTEQVTERSEVACPIGAKRLLVESHVS